MKNSRVIVAGLCLASAHLVGCTGALGDGPDKGSTSGGGGGATPTPTPAATDPGRVTLHRLNRVEYNNTVQDLFGTSMAPASSFPPDDRGAGFDNIADVLSLSPLQLSLYQSAAEQLVEEALGGPLRGKIVSCDITTGGDTCAREVLQSFGRRAWRRPLGAAEVDKLMTLVSLARSSGDSYDQGLSLALEATLLSPNFVFRVETDPSPTSLTPHPLNSYEVAARLSYFLWSTMPDAELSAAADAGELQRAENVKAQALRMMASPKAKAIVDNFAGQWLYTRAMDEVQPDPGTFPDFDESLRSAMKEETERFVGDVVYGGLPADQLLTADYTYLNDRLAAHYKLPAVGSKTMVKVQLDGSQRGGLLGNASVLTVTSHETATSPVRRGVWVLEQLLCNEIKPPPAGVMTDLTRPDIKPGSKRDMLSQHSANPCAFCHKQMDPIGFGLENYDAIGAYRTMDGAFVIDASGTLPDGQKFSGPRELEGLIAADPRFARCMTEKLYTYALGRTPDDVTPGHLDPSTLDGITETFRKTGLQFQDLVVAIVTSDTFLKRRGEP